MPRQMSHGTRGCEKKGISLLGLRMTESSSIGLCPGSELIEDSLEISAEWRNPRQTSDL